MKRSSMLTIASLLTILLFSVHLSDDIVRGFEPGGFKQVSGITIMVVWLFGTLILRERRAGYVIVLLGSLLASLMPLAHMRGAGFVGGRMANTAGMHLFVWTLLTVGVTAAFSVILSVERLWSTRREGRAS
jgi:hypothetical protein